jgi:hypothetical protein
MKYFRFRILLLTTATLLVIWAGGYSMRVIIAAQKEHSAHSNQPARYHYVCPMHDDATSKWPGTCPKCKMKLVRKSVPPKSSV